MLDETWFWIVTIIIELALAVGLFFAWRKLGQLKATVRTQQPVLLEQLQTQHLNLKKIQKMSGGIDAKGILPPLPMKPRLLLWIAGKFLQGGPVGTAT